MPMHAPGLDWIWIDRVQFVIFPLAAWGALRILTAWGYRLRPFRDVHISAFVGWLVLAGLFGNVIQASVALLRWPGPGLAMFQRDPHPFSNDGGFAGFYLLTTSLAFAVALGAAIWIGSQLVRRIEWGSARVNAAPDMPTPPATGWQYVYLSIAVAAAFPWSLSVAIQLFLSDRPSTSVMAAAPYLVSLALAVWLASGLVDDLQTSKLMGHGPAPTTPRLRQVAWVAAVGLLCTGLAAIPNAAILAALHYYPSYTYFVWDDVHVSDTFPPLTLMWTRHLWIELALLVALSLLMLRLLPKHHLESGPRHAFRGIRRVGIAVALAIAMKWPLDFGRMLIGPLGSLHIGSTAGRYLLIAVAIALVVWLFTWRPPVRG